MGWEERFAAELISSNGNRNQVVERYMDLMRFSKTHLYRIARSYGWQSGKQQRKDKGQMKSLTKGQLEYIGSLIHTTSREIKGPIMPVERALEIAEDNGFVDTGSVSVATVQRQLREMQCSAKMLNEETPYTPMRSLHPNHVHVFDVSVCIQYYLKKNILGILDERLFYKNKPDNYAKVKQRLMRYVLTDHFSGAFYMRYFYAGGESERNLLRFFLEAWGKKQIQKYPFHGVPFLMLMDAGAANTAGEVKSLFKGLEIEMPHGMPHNPRRQGTAESTHSIIEEHFESGLRIQPATSEDHLNEWAFDWAIKYNATKKHTRHRMTRTQCWMLIKPEQLRILPLEEKCIELMRKPVFTRVVEPDYTISYKNKIYNVKHIEGIRPRVQIEGHVKAFTENIDIKFREKLYECIPIEKLPAHLGGFRADAAIIGQEYKAQPETLTQQAIKRFDNIAYGEERKKGATPFAGLQVFGHHAKKVGNVSFIEKKGTPIEVDRSITEKSIPFTEFLKRLIQEVGPISKEMNQQLRAEHGDSIEITKAEELIKQVSELQSVKVSEQQSVRVAK